MARVTEQLEVPGTPAPDLSSARVRTNAAVAAVMEAEKALRLARLEERRARAAEAALAR